MLTTQKGVFKMERKILGYAVIATSPQKNILGGVIDGTDRLVYCSPDSTSGGCLYWSAFMHTETTVALAISRYNEAFHGYLANDVNKDSIKLVEVFVDFVEMDDTTIQDARKDEALKAARQHLTADQLKILGIV
jgi:hypothetical protein